MKRNILFSVLSLFSVASFAQSSNPQSNSDLEVTAVVEAGCDLSAENINFGVLMMPLSDQSAQSKLAVKCSKNAPYNIGVAFSDTDISGSSEIRIVPQYNGYHYIGDRVVLSNTYFECNSSMNGQVHFWTQEDMASLGLTWTGINWNPDTLSLCNNDGTVNQTTLSSLGYGSAGILKGMSAGEQIVYTISHPTDGTTWNLSNTFSSNGNGDIQNIVLKANIAKNGNPTHRMTPDTYQSTLTVKLIY